MNIKTKNTIYVSLAELKAHAEKPENLDRQFDLSSCTKCLCCDLTGREMDDCWKISRKADDPDDAGGRVDDLFGAFVDTLYVAKLGPWLDLWPTGRQIAEALSRIQDGLDPQEAAREMAECIRSAKTNEPQLIES